MATHHTPIPNAQPRAFGKRDPHPRNGDNPMSDLEARIAEVLNEHTLHLLSPATDDPNGPWEVECNCNMPPVTSEGFFDGEKKFAAHQAAMLLPVIREAQAEAWDECVHIYDSMVCLDCEPNAPTNPYRADNLATP